MKEKVQLNKRYAYTVALQLLLLESVNKWFVLSEQILKNAESAI